MSVPNEYVELPGRRQVVEAEEEVYINHDNDLESIGWFWGDISRSEATELMENQPDGSFLVRNASTQGNFTLTLKKGGVNRLIKIGHDDMGKCGFSEPYEFDSVIHLVDYFSQHTLQAYNSKLDVMLLYPIEKCKRDSVGDESEKKQVYRTVVEKLRQEEMKLETLYDKQSELNDVLTSNNMITSALEETIKIYEDQVHLQRQFHGSVSALDLQKLSENFMSLQTRLKEIQKCKETTERETNRLMQENRRLFAEISELKQEVLQISRDKQRRQKWLVETNTLPHSVQETWFVECDRQEAMPLLHKSEDKTEPLECAGTFLIRKTLKPGNQESYAISIINNGKVQHIKIHYSQDLGFGIAENSLIHPTLLDLVLHYESESLKDKYSGVDQTLKYPFRHQKANNFSESEPIYG